MEALTPPGPRTTNRLAVAAYACAMSIVGSLCFYVVIALLAPATIWTAGAVCGISGMLAGLAGILLGILALKQIKAAPAQKGKRLAIGSIIISGIYLLLLGFMFVSYL